MAKKGGTHNQRRGATGGGSSSQHRGQASGRGGSRGGASGRKQGFGQGRGGRGPYGPDQQHGHDGGSHPARGGYRQKQAAASRSRGSYGRGSRGAGGAGTPETSYIEGRRAAFEALETGVPLKRALIQEGDTAADPVLEKLVARLDGDGVPVEYVPRERLDRLSSHGAHQGVVLETRAFRYAEVSDIIRTAGDGSALVILLDHVTDEGNFGAIVRSAEVVGAAGVIIANARAASVNTAAYKTSAGAVLHVPIAQVSNLARAVDQLKEAGFWAAAASEHAEQDVWHAPLEGRICLVMGSEGSGVSALLQKKCDFACRLPQRGKVESLNVAQAATVLCYEWLRRDVQAKAETDASTMADASDAIEGSGF